eukprot:GHRR01014118.1.p1 GENE.GHRR01014118.1~~GHRR01014118.1.p1  ORF type:complete len:314 (+),score=87.64 GHRR01014118.1:261-1202(+)
MSQRLGRQLNAVSGAWPRPVPPAVGILQRPCPLVRGCRVATSSSHGTHGQAALSINHASVALPELGVQLETAAVPLEAAAAAAISSSEAAEVQQTERDATATAATAAALPAEVPEQKSGNFINRVIFGLILGFGGAAVVAAGKLPYLFAALFVVFHATQEFFGMLTSKGISKGMSPPPRFVSVATTALCLSITVFTYFTAGKSGAAMSVAAFCLLVMNIVINQKPTFAHLTSSVFGLFYCGYLPSFWIKLRNLDITGPVLQLPGVGSEVSGVPSGTEQAYSGNRQYLFNVTCCACACYVYNWYQSAWQKWVQQ